MHHTAEVDESCIKRDVHTIEEMKLIMEMKSIGLNFH